MQFSFQVTFMACEREEKVFHTFFQPTTPTQKAHLLNHASITRFFYIPKMPLHNSILLRDTLWVDQSFIWQIFFQIVILFSTLVVTYFMMSFLRFGDGVFVCSYELAEFPLPKKLVVVQIADSGLITNFLVYIQIQILNLKVTFSVFKKISSLWKGRMKADIYLKCKLGSTC